MGLWNQLGKGFKKATDVHSDSISETESSIVDKRLERFKTCFGLSTANVETLRQMREDVGKGLSIFLEVDQELDGDYIITEQMVGSLIVNVAVDPEKSSKEAALAAAIGYVQNELGLDIKDVTFRVVDQNNDQGEIEND